MVFTRSSNQARWVVAISRDGSAAGLTRVEGVGHGITEDVEPEDQEGKHSAGNKDQVRVVATGRGWH